MRSKHRRVESDQKKKKAPFDVNRVFLVGMTGFEPATSCSQSKRATNCATSRFWLLLLCFVSSLQVGIEASARPVGLNTPSHSRCASLGRLASFSSLLWAFTPKNSTQLFLVRSLPTDEIAMLSLASRLLNF